jgi:cellulose synthase operon protein C
MFLTSRQQPPPANWQDFESLCAKLWRHIWQDDSIHRFGRPGQAQHGVDIAGRPKGGGLVGIQCKAKDAVSGKALTLDEIKDEVAKAEGFDPPLTRLIFATTAAPDAPLQREVLKLAEERKQQGRFDVVLLSWTDVLDRMEEVPELAEIYGGQARRIIETQEIALDVRSEQREFRIETLETLRDIRQQFMAPSPPGLDDLLGGEIDRYRDLLLENKAGLALELLEVLRVKRWDGASEKTRYRILTNIAAAKTRLGREEGADDFIAALVHDPDAEHAQCNAAYGRLLKGDFEAARNIARATQEKFPKSAQPYALILAASSKIGDVNDPLSLLPDDLRDNPAIAYGVGTFYRDRADTVAARPWFARAYEKDPNQLEIRTAYAEQLLGDLIADRRLAATDQLSSQQQAELVQAEQLLGEIWKSVKDTDVAALQITVAMNLSMIYRLRGDYAAAEKTLDEALRVTFNDENLKLQRAFVAMERQDFETMLRMVSSVAEASAPVVSLLRVEALRRLNRNDEALSSIDDVIGRSLDDGYTVRAKRLRVGVIAQLQGTSAAVEAARAFAEEHNVLLARLAVAEALRANGNDEEARRAALALKAELTNDVAHEEWVAIATILAQLRLFGDAADVYHDLIPEARDGPIYQRYVACLMNADRRAEVLEAINRLPENERDNSFYLKGLAAAYERAGERTKALEYYARCVAAEPDDPEPAIRRIFLFYKAGERDKALEALEALRLPRNPSAIDLMFVAQVRAEYGQLEQAVEIGYRARKVGFDDPRIHLAYMNLIVLRERDETQFLELDRITGVAAFLLRDMHGVERWFVMEREHPKTQSGEISPESTLGRAAVDKKVGDLITLSESPLKVDRRSVSQIKHRAVHALHETMERFEEWFPGHPGLTRFSIKEEAGQVDLTEIQRVLRARSQQADDVEAAYRGGKLPLGTVAKMVGINPIELWSCFPADLKIEMVCCLGTAAERAQAIELVASKPKWIIDPLELLSIHVLGVHDAVRSTINDLGLCQSSLDMIEEVIAEKGRGIGKPSYTLAMIGDQIVRTEVSPEAGAARIQFLTGVRDWAKENLTIVPAIGIAGKPPNEQLREVLGQDFFDILLAAEGDNRCLLSDDFAFRVIASEVGNIAGAWLQALLMVACSKGLLSQERYILAVVKMLDAKRTFICVGDSEVRFTAFRSLTKGQVAPEFRTLCRAIGSPTASFADALVIVTKVLMHLWSSSADLRCQSNLTFALLSGITDQQPARINELLVRAAAVVNQVKHGHLLRAALEAWSFGHFVRCPG